MPCALQLPRPIHSRRFDVRHTEGDFDIQVLSTFEWLKTSWLEFRGF